MSTFKITAEQPDLNENDPVWGPAEQHIPHLLPDLMYMDSFDHEGVTIRQYKHIDTRRYVNLDDTGQAWEVDFIDCDSGEVSAHRITLAQALQLLEG
jgi:hypothetical protein